MSRKKSEVILPSKKDAKKTDKKKDKLSLSKVKNDKKVDKKTEKKTDAPKIKKSGSKKSLYSSLVYKHKAKKDAEARRKAEELAALPKDPVKRFFARLHPKRVFKWWFSWRGQKAILKFCAACFLLLIIFIGGLFLYYKKDLDEIRLDEMTVSETVNTYLDRNGVVLWKDTGNEDYRLVVDGSEISDYMRWATVAIEDRNFYNHAGVDFLALIRATLSTLTGQGVQGGSTLTQQLIKQVYFSDEAASANRGGLGRKIKELILSIELERMYDKEQIITMYLNQSPYGGRRNGVESAAQTYFGKSAKDLTLAESALLASIPNNPGVLNPYNTYGNDALIARQHKTLDVMAQMGYISQQEADEAKEVPILDTIKPEASQYSDMIAPHFVLEVRKQLEDKYGISTMRAGGWTIKTTLDARAQQIAENAVKVGASHAYKNQSDDIALVSIDIETSQVIAMVGSIDFYNVNYGELNATVDALIEPGSTIKPILDYAPLFMQRDGINYGPGTILKDENINSLYCAGYRGACSMTNATGIFYGDIPIRTSLARSLNIAAVKALYINGIDNSLEIAHALGDKSYCEGRDGVGLSIAIGSGCGVRMVEHANAYASIARGGAYKDISYILEVKNSSGDVIESWQDSPATQVVDPQVAYMLTDILSDRSSRWWNNEGYVVDGVWTATKTGTTTTSNSAVTKDSLMESYSTVLSTLVWNGNHDGSGLTSNTHDIARWTVNEYMYHVHHDVYGPDGKWSSSDRPTRPAGLKTLKVNGVTDIWPSWYNAEKNSGISKETKPFNKYNKLLAAECTPQAYKIEVEVTKTIDPVTKKESFKVDSPYNYEVEDTCDYVPPAVSISSEGGKFYATIVKGSEKLTGYTLTVDGTSHTVTVAANGEITGYKVTGKEKNVKITVSDELGYAAVSEMTLTPAEPEKEPESDEQKDEKKDEKPEQKEEKSEDSEKKQTESDEQKDEEKSE
ncbi:transglycosylase domain-containing protein [Candidatus Saccharibacteria bacterium]|nr:transglycosylase domain-containing protein [Candidatus Saccharibacteria bacterium]